MYADVYISYPLEEAFTYRIPDGMKVASCTRVKVNFSGRVMAAFVKDVHDREPSGFEAKDILDVIDAQPIYDRRLLDLAVYTASNYISSVGEALAMALPSGMAPSKRYKNPFVRSEPKQTELNDEQRHVYEEILSSFKNNKLAHLIFGITGSGKTEIYIEAVKFFLRLGRSVIYLVPEIALSSMVFERFNNVFGDDLIVYHSHLTPNQRLNNWMRFYRGEARIVVGTRSAIFLQCPRLGMIVIDEEHDSSYKEHSTPRYNARHIALYRSKTEGALVIMGSATPSVETLYTCERGVMKLHELKNRFGGAVLPEIDIVKINSTKPKHLISSALKLNTMRAVHDGKQVVYLLNRRGFAPIVICSRCGWTVECPHCNIGMNYHRDRRMLCHYCGFQCHVPEACPSCGWEDIEKVGSGTQRVEEMIESEFKDLVVFRLDQDSSRKKDTVPDLIGKMNRGEVNILVGTQLVAKGFDFHNITLVGVLLADIGMNVPDFRASERIFSLLVQVAGRSGRGEAPGKVIIQTLNADNPLFTYIRNQDYYGFYRSELAVRKMMHYPPFCRIARLLVRGQNEERVIASINALKHALVDYVKKKNDDISILGPSSAPFAKIGGNFRHHIILKGERVAALREAIISTRSAGSGKGLYLEIDMDPYDLL